MEVIQRKKYTLEFLLYEDGKTKIIRENEGFSLIELIGALALVQSHLTDLIKSPQADETEIISEVNKII